MFCQIMDSADYHICADNDDNNDDNNDFFFLKSAHL